MAAIDIEKEFKHYLEIFTHDEELGKILAKVSFQELFNDKFLTENSKYTSMDDLIWRSGFGIMNLLEVEQVNQDKWNEYIARNTECKTWHEFGKLAMIDWMKHKLEEAKQAKTDLSGTEAKASVFFIFKEVILWQRSYMHCRGF